MNRFEIERLGHQGDGIASGPLFAPGTLPGEVVSGTQVGDTLSDIRILTPSEKRVRPPCRHAKTCGGCNLQHVSDEFVAEFKLNVVKTALEAQGIDWLPATFHTSPPHSRRRATFSARRTKKGAQVGFHQRGSENIVTVPDCHVLRPALRNAVPGLEALTRSGGSRKGALKFTVTETQAGLDVLAEGGLPADGLRASTLAQIASQHGFARLTWGDELIAMQETPQTMFGTTRAVFPPGSFLQATREGQETLISFVIETVSGASSVVDLFAGCGTFSLPLAAQSKVHAVEGRADMTEATEASWRQNPNLKTLTAQTRDLFKRPLMPDELDQFDAAVIDPPRAGAVAQTQELANSRLKTVAMVSCNPVSFARDAKTLADAGFTLERLAIVDQFRWSAHVEIAAAFHR